MSLSPTQRKILEVLGDGKAHTADELKDCIADPLADYSNVKPHLSHLRITLRKQDEDILCVWIRRQRLYQWVRLLLPKPPA